MSDDAAARRRSLRDDMRQAAHRLREEGRTVNEIADRLGVPNSFQRPTLKGHSPRTARTNVGADYRGCLVVRVPRSRELCLWMAGVVEGLVALHAPDPSHREVDDRR